MKKTILLLILILMSVCVPDLFAQTQADMDFDAQNAYLASDKKLAAVYNEIQNKYADDPAFLKKLKISEMLWLKLRDADLEMKYPYANTDSAQTIYGSVFPVCYYSELKELTDNRVKWLQQWIDGEAEGDVCTGSMKIKD
jgi:uncharacterized protein YecT (DUF1311 family)